MNSWFTLVILAVAGFPPVEEAPGAFAGLEKEVRLMGRPALLDALDQIAVACDVKILLDKPALQGRWGEMEPKDVALEIIPKAGSGSIVLRRVLQPLDLRAVKMGDHILVTSNEMALPRLHGQRVSISARAQPLIDSLKDLSRQTGATILLDPRVADASRLPITFSTEDVTLEAGVRILSELAGLKMARMDAVLFVTTPAAAMAIRQESGESDGNMINPGPPMFVAPPVPGVAPGGGPVPIAPNAGDAPPALGRVEPAARPIPLPKPPIAIPAIPLPAQEIPENIEKPVPNRRIPAPPPGNTPPSRP